MIDKNHVIIAYTLCGVFALLCTISVGRAYDYSRRLGEAEQRVDNALEALGTANSRSIELVEDVRNGLGEVADCITDGTTSISARIRETAKTVKAMENRLLEFERGTVSNNNIVDNRGGE